MQTASSVREVNPDSPKETLVTWVGPDDRGLELEVVAVEIPAQDRLLVIHVMPTRLRRNRPS